MVRGIDFDEEGVFEEEELEVLKLVSVCFMFEKCVVMIKRLGIIVRLILLVGDKGNF